MNKTAKTTCEKQNKTKKNKTKTKTKEPEKKFSKKVGP